MQELENREVEKNAFKVSKLKLVHCILNIALNRINLIPAYSSQRVESIYLNLLHLFCCKLWKCNKNGLYVWKKTTTRLIM